jgi:tRNA threonylcarbamoyl adenosine modification protein YeaZ
MIEGQRVVLAIDTASPEASVAIEVGNDLHERRWLIETTVSRELLAEVETLLSEAGVGRDALDAMAICTGPGSYGGLRAGIATAQGMALALDVSLAAVGRFEADAALYLPSAAAGRPVIAVHQAGRARLGWAAYTCPADAELPVELVPPTMSSAEECAQQAPAGAIWCGELSEELDTARAAAGRDGDAIALAADHSRATAILELARKRYSYDDPALADAIYLRPPAITPPKATPTP